MGEFDLNCDFSLDGRSGTERNGTERNGAERCGRVACYRNHSKIYAGYGSAFPFAIESSANINTNPRAEQTVITISADLARFYFEWFGNIKTIKEYE